MRPGYEANIRLGEAVSAGLRRRAAAAAALLPDQCAEIADEMRPGPEVEGCVLNASFLVPRRHEADFRAVVERCAAAHPDRLELRLTGPLPCYSFVGPEHAPARV